ncbi:HAD family phosphatase [Siculibacillus lacustris]|uniref:HAD family phosphatase n=1 Tax=Siculibacillus lacustris TaxID=1549641 RepID=A0A4V2KSL0_9HYPH|nr:HAD family phosphatase [Siculibacillus lacustris]TBW33277.1 HAD family phosphatase [Siculibacillus lacustris]
MDPTRLVVFDCDGVLVDSELLASEAYARVFARHGGVIPAEVFGQCVGMKQADILAKIRDLTGLTLPPGAESEIWPETEALFATSLAPTAGLIPFLERLGTARCVASSSSPERIRRSLALTGLTAHFGDAVFSTSMVARSKPAPDIFLHAAAAFGLPPARCVVIEDSPYGIAGAVAAGMTALGFTGGSHSDPSHGRRLLDAGADRVCADWHAVGEALAARGFVPDEVPTVGGQE